MILHNECFYFSYFILVLKLLYGCVRYVFNKILY